MKRTPFRRKPPTEKPPKGYGKSDLPPTWPAGYIPEKTFQTNVEKLAEQLGWMTSHSHLPYFDTAGWPDLAMVHPVKKKFLVRELKVTSAKGRVGKPTPTQWQWITALADAGIDVGVWTYPMDWDRLEEELKSD